MVREPSFRRSQRGCSRGGSHRHRPLLRTCDILLRRALVVFSLHLTAARRLPPGSGGLERLHPDPGPTPTPSHLRVRCTRNLSGHKDQSPVLCSSEFRPTLSRFYFVFLTLHIRHCIHSGHLHQARPFILATYTRHDHSFWPPTPGTTIQSFVLSHDRSLRTTAHLNPDHWLLAVAGQGGRRPRKLE